MTQALSTSTRITGFFYPHEHPAGPANDGRYADGGAGGGGGGGEKGATSAFPR